MREKYTPLIDEKEPQARYEDMEEQQLLTESEVLQEEIITRMPGFVRLMLKYEWKPLTKILIAIVMMVVIYYAIGWDAVASGIALYVFLTAISYVIQLKHQERDSTIFVEMKLPGQYIETGEHSPYSQSFFTTEGRFAVWEVPNTIIRADMFKVPGEQKTSILPGTGSVYYVDLFDRINRTCVLPRDIDVSNISYATNANPMLAEKLNNQAEQIKVDKRTERIIKDLYSTNKISAKDAKAALKPIEIRTRALLSPTNKTKRDIFFELQSIVPDMREKIQLLTNKMFLFSEFLAAQGIYELTNRAMPEAVRDDHNFMRTIMGFPKIPKAKK